MGPGAVAIVRGANLVTRSRDTEFPFRQDSDFWYLTGFDHPRRDGGAAHRRRPRLHAVRRAARPRAGDLDRLPARRRGRASQDFGADEAYPNGELLDEAPRADPQRAAHLPRARPRSRARRAARRRARRRCGCARARTSIPADAIVDPRAITHEMRLFKDPSELDLMRRAAAISREGHARGRAARVAGRVRVRAPGRARVHVPAARRARARLHHDRRRRRERHGPALRAQRPEAARGRARADRRGLRARGLRLGRDAHLSGRRALHGARARDLRGGARARSRPALDAVPPGRDAARRCTTPR